jgi:hypothetical protein
MDGDRSIRILTRLGPIKAHLSPETGSKRGLFGPESAIVVKNG